MTSQVETPARACVTYGAEDDPGVELQIFHHRGKLSDAVPDPLSLAKNGWYMCDEVGGRSTTL